VKDMGFLGFSNGIRRRSIKKEENVFQMLDREQREGVKAKPTQPSFTGGIVRKATGSPISIARERQQEARRNYLGSVSLGNIDKEKEKLRAYKRESASLRSVEKAQEEQKKESIKYKVKEGVGSVFNYAFTSKGRMGTKPKKLRSKAVSGIYRSPFGR